MESSFILPEVEPGGSFLISASDLYEGFTDPEGDDLYITDVGTEYGYWDFDIDTYKGVFPISDDISLTGDDIRKRESEDRARRAEEESKKWWIKLDFIFHRS